ncbi:hypothetical protein Sulku_2572 (plasmid) [Sulfuricurvum kujiense DSM 16994]|uniref:DUF4282 domain-containing protein n=1 Tax=Sulfuricurvum kujiense (strain ATCC BAA-921 / DSM 16994 / JCM 11577 / YK-1) TaxID=709032 RepID=E4U3G5_SULKY|nr:DUF4282 domain-containing protein [Sulfuricurvum kujiense]ADR35231.1 hypothetical protein Sulku_2572 [Sulfuricurvum kujiense DSM 16994]
MEFLTFDSFISIPVLIAFYYLGALLIPALLWTERSWVIKVTDILVQHFPIATSRLIIGFMLLFMFFELMWRMMFEMLIGYFKMIEYLHLIAS